MIFLPGRARLPTNPSSDRIERIQRRLVAIADACGLEWGHRAREAIMVLHEKERAERLELTIVRHGLILFDTLGVDQIGSVQFNQELRRLDLPDARWTRYRGASGIDYAHPIEMFEQANLLHKVGIKSTLLRFDDGHQRRGYKRGQFEEALRSYESGAGRAHLRLVSSEL